MQAEEEGSRLTNEELTANIILLFGAGHETTVNLIGNGLLALLRNPDQLGCCGTIPRSSPTPSRSSCATTAPCRSPAASRSRTSRSAAPRCRRARRVLCLLGAANRDPAVYPDPDRLDVTRANIRPMSFGGGIHFCLGAQLARIEAEVAIMTLLRACPA